MELSVDTLGIRCSHLTFSLIHSRSPDCRPNLREGLALRPDAIIFKLWVESQLFVEDGTCSHSGILSSGSPAEKLGRGQTAAASPRQASTNVSDLG